MTESGKDPRVEAQREMIKRRMVELGMKARNISKAIGKDPCFVGDFIGPINPTKASKPPKKNSMNTESLMAIEKILGFERGELSNVIGPMDIRSIPMQTPIIRKFPLISPPGLPASRKIPLYAMVNLRTGGVRMSQAAEFETPIGIENTEKTFAVVMPDATMRPAFDVGHKLIVQPDTPISASEFVFIEIASDGGELEGFVRRLAGRSEEGLRTETLNPAEEIVVPHADIVSIAPIIGVLFKK